MILVAGGTGTLGTQLVRRLLARGLRVRVLTRDAARVSDHDEHLEVVEADVRSHSSVVRAMAEVDTVVSAVHGFAGTGGVSPASVDRDGNANLIDAAAAGNAAVVLMSVVGASADSLMELFRMKHAAEQHLRASGVPWTIVRSTAFLEMWVALLEQTAQRSGRPLVFGRGDNPINFVSVRDVAVLLERVLTDSSTRGQTFEIGGPQNLSFNQLAAALQEAAGRISGPRHVPRPALKAMTVALRPFRPDLARQARAALVLDSAGLVFDATAIHKTFPCLPSTTLAELLGGRGAGNDERPSDRDGGASRLPT
ncbi:SDR family oxidoreductase [Candidatus Nephthysia bennettiae]|uniref:SDR family oxidoreductase n=1 Tax=Candidatus Nephthysia bennettiae TaxID=3127016 RepID=A0A934K0Y2_9BACT|nr:SDR family oxidoreductase [Candidatus Dormibacteraeota bacterium]MBJ7610956.1 SDR family oxidoreductase [Candidatus Dormibacteraeota bacterium]